MFVRLPNLPDWHLSLSATANIAAKTGFACSCHFRYHSSGGRPFSEASISNSTVSQSLGFRTNPGFALDLSLYRFVNFSPGMDSAPNYRNILGQIVVSGIAICMQVPVESFPECFRMLCTSARLVLIQNNGFICISTRPVQPHIALALRCPSRFMEHL